VNTPFRFTMVADISGDNEEFDLLLDEECLGVPICRLFGTLTPEAPEPAFPVNGFQIGRFVYFEMPFRRAKLLMGGVRDFNDDLHMKYIGVEPESPVSESAAVSRVNPDVGDTGTGTGTQTLLAESRERTEAQ